MMTDAERRLLVDLELLYSKWSGEWAMHVRSNTQPTREDERVHLQELKKIITNHTGVDLVKLEGYLK